MFRKQKAVEGGVDVVKNQLQSFISECDKILTLYNRNQNYFGYLRYNNLI